MLKYNRRGVMTAPRDTRAQQLDPVLSEQVRELCDPRSLRAQEVLTQRKLLQSGPLSHQLAVCEADAKMGVLCPIIAHYISVCRKCASHYPHLNMRIH